jgi:hypothetical protein
MVITERYCYAISALLDCSTRDYMDAFQMKDTLEADSRAPLSTLPPFASYAPNYKHESQTGLVFIKQNYWRRLSW